MTRIAFLILFATNVFAADSGIDFDTGAKIYQAAAVRDQVRASLGAMPNRIRQMFAADAAAHFNDSQLAAVSAAAEKGFRISVFEPSALAALAAKIDSSSAKKALAFLASDLGKRMVSADVEVATLDEPTIDKIMSGELSAPSTPKRDALFAKLETASRSTESTVQIFLAMGKAVAIGTAIGGGLDPVAVGERSRKSADSGRVEMEKGMDLPLRRYMAYGYRALSDSDLKKLLAFLQSTSGKQYVDAYIAALTAGYDAMGRRCGEQLGESLRELAQVQAQ